SCSSSVAPAPRYTLFPYTTLFRSKGINLYNPATDIIQECGVGGIPSDCGIKVSHKLFSPSVGIAWRAFKSFVVRAGFALSPLQRSEEHTSELQSLAYLVCRLLLEK